MAATRCSSSLAPSAGQPRFRARAATRRGRIRSAAGGFEDRSVIATLLTAFVAGNIWLAAFAASEWRRNGWRDAARARQ